MILLHGPSVLFFSSSCNALFILIAYDDDRLCVSRFRFRRPYVCKQSPSHRIRSGRCRNELELERILTSFFTVPFVRFGLLYKIKITHVKLTFRHHHSGEAGPLFFTGLGDINKKQLHYYNPEEISSILDTRVVCTLPIKSLGAPPPLKSKVVLIVRKCSNLRLRFFLAHILDRSSAAIVCAKGGF